MAPEAVILIIEDESNLRVTLAAILRRHGYRVCDLASAESAIAYLQENNCDLIVTDLRLPGMDGIELLGLLHSRFPAIPVIVLTAFPSAESQNNAQSLGAADYLRKPIEPDQLVMRIDELLSASVA